MWIRIFWLTLFLIVQPVAPHAQQILTPSYATPSATGLEWDTNRPGSDYKYFEFDEAAPFADRLCRNLCDDDPECLAWTFEFAARSPGYPSYYYARGHCWLKNAVPDALYDECCVSGTIAGREPTVEVPPVVQPPAQEPPVIFGSPPELGELPLADEPSTSQQSPPSDPFTPDVSAGIVPPLELNTNRPGSDYHNFVVRTADPNACLAACQQDTHCRAWTFVNRGVGGSIYARCWLKDIVPAPQPDSCCTSGTK